MAVIGKIISGGQTGADRGALEAALKAIASYDNVTSANQVLATNGVVYAGSGNLATIDLFLPAPSARSSFYKVFALEELPAKE